MVVDEFKLVNNDNGKGIKFHWARAFTDNITINNVTFPLAGSDSSENYAANWGGFKRLISVQFVLYSDGSTDKSTDGSSKVTLQQQWQHLMDPNGVIQGKSTEYNSVTFTLTISIEGSTTTYSGVIEDITVDAQTSDATFLSGSFNMYIGTN